MIKSDSDEMLSLYLNLQSTDRQFQELIEEEIERKQFVIETLRLSEHWNQLSRILNRQSAEFTRPTPET